MKRKQFVFLDASAAKSPTNRTKDFYTADDPNGETFSGLFLTESLNFLKSTYFLSFLSSSERFIGLSAVEKIIATQLSSRKIILRISSISLVDLVSPGRVETLKILLSIKTNARLECGRLKGLTMIETWNRNSLRRNFRFHLAA